MALPNWQRTITTTTGDVVPGAEVEVVNEATGLPADLYTSRAGTSAKANPFFADSSGFAEFYADPGEYRITATGAAGSQTWRYEVLSGTAALMTNDTGGESLGSAALMTNNTGGERLLQEIVQHPLTEATGGKWVVHESTNGVPCVFYRMPAFSYDDLQIANCPFTGVMDLFKNPDGSIRPYHDFAVYMASGKNGDLVSVGGGVPVNRINYDEFLQQAADSGFQMFGVYERACLNWLMIANSFQPRGNTEYGRSHEIFREFGQRQDGRVPNDRSGEARTLTGTGPKEWNHDGTEFGIADLVGNQWEWVTGLKLVDGQFFVAQYHDQPESSWIGTGSFINSGGVLDNSLVSGGRSSMPWADITKANGYTESEILQRLCIEPIDCTRILNGRFYYDTTGERSPFVGGNWGNGSAAGPAVLSLYDPRSYRYSSIGGRLTKRSDS